ncbi:SPFH domain-containing protein [Flavitalea sp. BT771]|uniref:SPFH domain-containing protein n=1 Tax=Flavitalea sp. BT771 TaxID=3063329 RepID=UPI0026E14777|nr:SPFH domain-containing protein [Flavitalea sp. BT771]MDO6435269.1 SPFH domain-containing protein [Flavitalea sp. BT771]MDV6224026.1 SPFH domain-containing protein [Flavitalea sp. BT771]
MQTEKIIKPANGYLFIALAVLVLTVAVLFFFSQQFVMASITFGVFIFVTKGLAIVNPNTGLLLLLFGDYAGSIKESGLFWINPLYKRMTVSLRARNFESDKVKVNDKMGNPIMISVILVWKVRDTFKSFFEVDNYEKFIMTQTDSAVRKLAASYPYDHFEDERAAVTLSTDFDEVNRSLEKEIAERLVISGIEILEARISHLAYAPEIAHSMLRRQQASAVVAARSKIVEGAVGMVESALHLLSTKNIIDLDEDKKAAMVSNLMVVLCGDRETQPVVNTGTLNQ